MEARCYERGMGEGGGRASASWVGATTLENEGGKGVPFAM